MRTGLRSYLNALARKSKLDPRTHEQVVRELEAHLEEKVRELMEEGLSSEEAERRAIGALGHPDMLARELHAVHSSGSWPEILLAALPHLLLAVLFLLHLWSLTWVVLLLVGITFVTLWGWRVGKPRWSYPWLGYSLAAPALSWLLTLVSLAYGGWMYFTTGALPYSLPIFILLLAYIPFSLWLVATVVLKVVRQDWLLAGLTALPFPFLTSWLLFLDWRGGLWAPPPGVMESDGSRALVFLALALTTGVFLKAGHRLVKIGLLTAATALLVVYTTLTLPLSFNMLAVILIAIASVAFLLSPALLEARLRRKEGWYAPLDAYQEVVTHWFATTK